LGVLFLQDLKVAVRSLAKVPALWVTVALTLGLGIGANAAIFSVVRTVLLRPLANRDEDRLLYVRQSAAGLGQVNTSFSVPEIEDVSKGLRTMTKLGTISQADFTIVGLGTPREVPGGVVDGNYFDVMGLRPVLGRLLGPADDGPNAAGAVVLTYRFWVNSLHSDPEVLGKTIRLESCCGARSATIVGVLEPAVPYPVATEILANLVTSPHHLSATMVTGRTHRMTEVFGRLAPGATLEAARAEMKARYAGMVAAHPETYKASDHFAVGVTRMHQTINEKANTVLWILFAASGLLFVIACSNVANLVLARTVRREPELAIRSALGASRAVLRRSLLAEGLVLSVSGAVLAVAIAVPMVGVLGRYAARFSVRAEGLRLDFSLVWMGIGLAVLAAVVLAFVPRLPAGQVSQAFAGVRTTGGSGRRLRVFAVTQITASFLLLAGAGALMKTLFELEKMQPPFDSGQVLALNMPLMNYGRTPEQVQQFYRDVEQRVGALPGVEHVAGGFSVPWRDTENGDIQLQFAVDGAKRQNGAEDMRARFRAISPGYFGTLGMPLLEGRDLQSADRDGAERVVVVSEGLAKALFPGQSALNRELRWTDPVLQFVGISGEPRRIVGVVPDFDDQNIIPQASMEVYQPVDQEGWNGRLFVRTKGDPYAMVPTITKTVREMDADQPVERASTLADIRAEVLTPDKLNAVVFGGFAAVALIISVVGVAGVLAFSVSGRTREFGIRMALGAQPRVILADVLGQGLVIASIGVAMGVVTGIGLAKALSMYVADLKMPGVVAFVASGVVILGAAMVAAVVPAARAARVNPVEGLRAE
jgi:putative ABC transport system permease protein